MRAYGLGKITVAAAGTPAQLTIEAITSASTSAGAAIAAAGNLCHKIEFWADPAMSGTTAYIKDGAGTNTIAPLLKPANGWTGHYVAKCDGQVNLLDPTNFYLDVATNGDGLYITIWIA